MNNEQGLKVYRKLIYFKKNNLPIHFTLYSGGWKNGYIIDLNEEKLTLVLEEFEEGMLPFVLEEIILEWFKINNKYGYTFKRKQKIWYCRQDRLFSIMKGKNE